MAVTGTNTFSVTRDEIIKAALRVLQVIGVGEVPVNEDYINCSQALNIMIKGWSANEQPLWVLQNIEIPLVQDNVRYELGPTATGTGAQVMSRPIGTTDAFIRDGNGHDRPLYLISREEYNDLSDKDSASNPNLYYYDRQEPNGVLYLFGKPENSTDVLHLRAQRQFYDMTDADDTFDFPEEFFQALKWGLAAELYLEYPVAPEVIQVIELKAEKYRMDAFDGSVEDASVFFTAERRNG